MTTWAGLFARQPVAGEVKTRLQSVLTSEEASRLYAAFVYDTAATLATCWAEQKIVAYTGAGAGEGLPHLLAGLGPFDYLSQEEGSLGARMQAFFAAGFDAGSKATVLIGTDSPSMPVELIDEALRQLATHDIVIGPSTDGGYYLVGLSASVPALFSDAIEWGTGNVLRQTLDAASGNTLSLLPVWYDVDLPQEAAFLRTHLQALHQAGKPTARRSLAVLEELSLPAPS